MKPLDVEALEKGTVPWSVDEFYEVMEWYHKLKSTPIDDWDLEERSLLIEDDETGNVEKIIFNPSHSMNQLAFYLRKRYGNDEMPYRMNRFTKIVNFLAKHNGGLVIDGLARPCEDCCEIRDEVFQALCMLTYSKVEIVDGEKCTGFDYDEVVTKARQLMQESDDA